MTIFLTSNYIQHTISQKLQTGLQQYCYAPGTLGDALTHQTPPSTWHTAFVHIIRRIWTHRRSRTDHHPCQQGCRNTFRPNFWNSIKISRSECVKFTHSEVSAKFQTRQATPPISATRKVSVFKLHPLLTVPYLYTRKPHAQSFIVGVGILFYTKAYLLFKDRNLSIIYYLN